MTKTHRFARAVPRLLLFISIALGGGFASVARADIGLPPVTFNVAPGPDVIANNGACSLREALINANNNNQSGSADCPVGQADTTDTISLQAGQTYTLTIDGSNNDTNSAEGDLDVLDNTAALDLQIVSDGTQRATMAFDQLPVQSNRVLDVHSGASVLLRGVSITGGDGGNYNGGGIQNNGTLTLENSEIVDNRTSAGASTGGGIYTGPGSSLSIRQNSAVRENVSLSNGGGIYNDGGTVTIEASGVTENIGDSGGGIFSIGSNGNPAKLTITAKSTVSNNIANDAAGDGGGVWNGDKSTTMIEQSVLESNYSHRNGGAIAGMAGGSVTVSQSTLISNMVVFGNDPVTGQGGALWNAGNASVTASTISNNKAGKGANSHGGAFANIGTLLLFNSAVSGNQTQPGSGGNGGAIYNTKTLVVINSTLSGNSADGRGGAISTSGGYADIRHATITANTATAASGGLYLLGPSPKVDIKHSILAGNTAAGNPADCDNGFATLTSNGYNLVGTACGGAFGPASNDLVGVDPKLAALADNDGATKTHAPQLGSPALNAIPKVACADDEWPQLTTDQRGIARPQGTGCEIGAYEQKPLDIVNPNPKPMLTNLAPDNTPVGGGDFVLVVMGEKFVQGSEVYWKGVARPTSFVSASELKANISADDIASAGAATITVFNPAPAGGFSNALTFIVTAPDKQNQTITFAPIAERSLVEGGLNLSATASSGLPVSYTASGACAVNAGEVMLLQPGMCLITAGQPGDDAFNPAPSVAQSFKIIGEQTFLPMTMR